MEALTGGGMKKVTMLAEGLALLRRLRESGLTKQPGYNIEHPFSRPIQRVPNQDEVGKW